MFFSTASIKHVGGSLKNLKALNVTLCNFFGGDKVSGKAYVLLATWFSHQPTPTRTK